MHNLETGRPDRAEGEGRKAGEYRVKRQNRELRQSMPDRTEGSKVARRRKFCRAITQQQEGCI